MKLTIGQLKRVLIEAIGDDAFERADKKVHPVESQWHYPILTKYGFQPLTKEAVGFVRSYEYDDTSGHKIKCTTGVNSDYWEDPKTKKSGYWSDLEPYLKTLTEGTKLTIGQLRSVLIETIKEDELQDESPADFDLEADLDKLEVGDVVDVDVDEIGIMPVRVIEFVDDVNKDAGPRGKPNGPGYNFHGPGFVGEIDPSSGESGTLVCALSQVLPGSKAKGYFPRLGEPEEWLNGNYGDHDEYGRKVQNPYRKAARQLAQDSISRQGDYSQVEGMKRK